MQSWDVRGLCFYKPFSSILFCLRIKNTYANAHACSMKNFPPYAADATYQIADATGVMYGDGEPRLCPAFATADTQPDNLDLTETTASWQWARGFRIWGFKVRPQLGLL